VATHKSALKRARQAEKRRLRNRSAISQMKTRIKKIYASMEAKNIEEVKTRLREATAYIDKIADKGIIHKNKASRLVSRLTRKVNKFMASLQSEGTTSSA